MQRGIESIRIGRKDALVDFIGRFNHLFGLSYCLLGLVVAKIEDFCGHSILLIDADSRVGHRANLCARTPAALQGTMQQLSGAQP